MIKLRDILLESEELDILKPRRGKEQRVAQYKTLVNRKIQEYIKNGSKGDLDLVETDITELPSNLTHVGRNLILDGSMIQKLPDNLTVGRGLYLNRTPITKLPDNLTVGHDLYMSHSRLSELPTNLSVARDINLAHTPLSKKYSVQELKHLLPGVKGYISYNNLV